MRKRARYDTDVAHEVVIVVVLLLGVVYGLVWIGQNVCR